MKRRVLQIAATNIRQPIYTIRGGNQTKAAPCLMQLHQAGCRFSLITAPDCVNWLANIRGRDLQYTPFHLCFGLLRDDGDLLFIGGGAVLQEVGYRVLAFDEIAGYLAGFKGDRISCDPASWPDHMKFCPP